MSTYLRGTVWWIDFEYQGQRIKESVPHATCKIEARTAELDRRRQLKEETRTGFVEMTLGKALEQYLDTVVVPAGSPSSIETFKQHGRMIVAEFGENTPVHQLAAPRVHRWRDGMLTGGRMMGKPRNARSTAKGLSVGTVNQRLGSLIAVLNKCHREWGSLMDPPKIIRAKVPKDRHPRYFTDAEERAILKVIDPMAHDLIVFLLGTGARVSEALQLTWDDIEGLYSNNQLAKVTFRHDPDEGRRTKSKASRTVPILHPVRLMLLKIRERQQERGYPGDHMVFARVESFEWKPLVYNTIAKAFRVALAEAKVTKATIHTTRHTYASRLVQKGVPLINVRDLLGHASVKQTEVYAHLIPSSLDQAVMALAA